jgi:hypothetical protein
MLVVTTGIAACGTATVSGGPSSTEPQQTAAPASAGTSPGDRASATASIAPSSTGPSGISTGSSRGPGLPDPALTPGARNPDVTPADLGSTICKSGWTKTVRPPVSYTNSLKKKQIAQYGYADTDLRHYEEDHLIPLEVGGAPRDARNLWPEPRTATLPDGTKVGAVQKDGLENYLHARVCNGSIPLGVAQDAFAKDWVAAWEAYGRP